MLLHCARAAFALLFLATLALLSLPARAVIEKINPKDGAVMVWVPGGTFSMGSLTGVGDADEHPVHQVTLSGYWIYKHEVTVAQYRVFCTATNRVMPPSLAFNDTLSYSWKGTSGWTDPIMQQHPMANVSWHDAKAYAEWAGMTLPSEAQWEYAARGPQANNYPWGGSASPSNPTDGWNAQYCVNQVTGWDIGKSSYPVGSFVNDYSWCGAKDMAGNVFEWCNDWYGYIYYMQSNSQNPTGPVSGEYKVVRGGCFGSGNNDSRGAKRRYDYPQFVTFANGFRCASIFNETDQQSYKPDAKIRITPEQNYIGDNIYNTDAANQTSAASVLPGAAATVLVQVQNDGASADSFMLTGTAGDGVWAVRYYAMTSNVEITAQVTGGGYATGTLPSGAAAGIYAKVIPARTAPSGAVKALTLTATSTGDAAKVDVVKVVATVLPASQPDLMVRTPNEAAYGGSNVYNLSGFGQTRAQTVATGAAASYLFRIQNDGNTADAFTLTGPAGGSGWTVRYYMSLNGGTTEITAAMTGAGWSTGPLAALASLGGWVTVTPGPLASASFAQVAPITAVSQADGAKKDVLKTVTSVAERRQPDLKIRLASEAAYSGDDIYNTTGAGQTKAQSCAPGATVSVLFHLQNDGNLPDGLKVTATGGDAAWTVTYFDNAGADITAAITGAGWLPPVLSQQGVRYFRAAITASNEAVNGNTKSLGLYAASLADPTKRDVAKATVTVVVPPAPVYQPDLHLRAAPSPAYLGDNVYNLDGANQTAAQSCAVGETVTFLFKAQNDGTGPDTLTVTGPGNTGGWLVRYYEMSTNAEVTTQLTGAGYSTGALAKNGSKGLYVKVTATSGVTPGASQALLLTAVSAANGAKKDVVKAVVASDDIQKYQIQDLGTMGWDQSFARSINNAGLIVGSTEPNDGRGHGRGFLWTPQEGMIELGTLGGFESEAYGINDHGYIVGMAENSDEIVHATMWNTQRDISDLGAIGLSSIAFDINNTGHIAGNSYGAFLWKSNVGMTSIGVNGYVNRMNNADHVVGNMSMPVGPDHAFLWTPDGGIQDLGTLGGDHSLAWGINNSGVVVGLAQTASQIHAFKWTCENGMTDLGTLGGNLSIAISINDAGNIVGCSRKNSDVLHACLWKKSGQVIELGTLSGGSESVATDINELGYIVGYAKTSEGLYHAVLWTPID